jgi:hypothetical protein
VQNVAAYIQATQHALAGRPCRSLWARVARVVAAAIRPAFTFQKKSRAAPLFLDLFRMILQILIHEFREI